MKTVIEMAREAGIDWHRHWNDDESNRLEKFAELVRADHLKSLLAGVEMPEPQDSGHAVDGIEIQTLSYIQMHEFAASAVARNDAERDALKAEVERLKAAVADEREGCAKVADEWGKNNMTAVMIAEDIRARNK